MRFLVLNWAAWDGFLLREILPSADKIDVTPYEPLSDDILSLATQYDLVFLNLDLTDTRYVFPNQYDFVDAIRHGGGRLANFYWQNIDKVNLQEFLSLNGLNTVILSPNENPDTEVIVKTRQNYGGEPEKRLLKNTNVTHTDNPGGMLIGDARSYVVTTLRKYRSEFVKCPSLCVEKFIKNVDDIFFRVYVAGMAVLAVRAHCTGPIKKICDDPRDTNCFSDRESLDLLAENREFGPELANTISMFLSARPVDFCSLDIVTDQQRFYIVDVNTTPWCGQQIPKTIGRFLNAGLTYSA